MRDWLRTVDGLVRALSLEWNLEVGVPFSTGASSWAAPAKLVASGEQAVLKVSWPHEEARTEPEALESWGGFGAARLLAVDRQRSAMLIERCAPGHSLLASNNLDEVVAAVASISASIWLDSGGPRSGEFASLSSRLEEWSSAPTSDRFASWFSFMPKVWRRAGHLAQSSKGVLLHGDLNPTNVLWAGKKRQWLCIDPKPLIGPPAFDLAPIVLQKAPTLGSGTYLDRVIQLSTRLADETGADKEDVLEWCAIRSFISVFLKDADEIPLSTDDLAVGTLATLLR